MVLASICDELSRGIIPKPISVTAGGKGRRQRGAAEAKHIAIATAYIRLVQAERLVDEDPYKTVSDAFKVTRKAAIKWGKEPLPKELCALFDWEDADLSDWKQIRFEQAGPRYHETVSRSTAAIARRATKREHK